MLTGAFALFCGLAAVGLPAHAAPLLHLGELDTADVAAHGAVWVSGTSLVWGALPRIHVETNLPEDAGLNYSLRLNPNLGVRVQLRSTERGGAGLLISGGVRGELSALNALKQTTTRVIYADDGSGQFYQVVSKQVVDVRNVRPWTNRAETYSWRGDEPQRDLLSFERLHGWRATAWLATAVRLKTGAGGSFTWHTAGALAMHPAGWRALPAWSVWTGVDFDLGRARLFGAVSWDPDKLNTLTRQPGLNVDLGLVWAWTPRFRTMFHLRPSFLGLLWQLR